MENLSCHSGKILTYLSICLFYLFSLFAGSGVAARTPRREQAEGETSLRQNLFLKNSFLFHLFYPLQFVQPFGQVIGFCEIVYDVKFTKLAIWVESHGEALVGEIKPSSVSEQVLYPMNPLITRPSGDVSYGVVKL